MLPESFTPRFLSQLELLKIEARRAFLGNRQGGHISPKRGHGIEFSDYRKYELGDNPRHIDWGVYARSDRLYVKRFQEEQDLTVLIVIDTSASMIYPANEGKWERARDLGLALAYIALMEGDGVIVSAPGHLITPRYSGGRAIHQLSDALMKIKLGEVKDFRGAVREAVARIRFPGVAIFISDFMMEIDEVRLIFSALQAKNLDVSSIQVLGSNEVSPFPESSEIVAIDSETGEEVVLALGAAEREDYGILLVKHNQALKEYFHSRGISFAQNITEQSLSEFMLLNLPKVGLLK